MVRFKPDAQSLAFSFSVTRKYTRDKCGLALVLCVRFISLSYSHIMSSSSTVWRGSSPSPPKICWITILFLRLWQMATAPAAWNYAIVYFRYCLNTRAYQTSQLYCVCVHVHSRTAWKQRVCLCVCWRVSMQTNCIVALATALVLVRFVKNSTVLETHHHAVDRNFSLGKGFFIAIARQLSPAKRHIHTSNSLLVIRIRRQ